MRLSAPMHEVLIAATRNPLRRTHDDTPGAPPWPANPSTLAALVRHGLLEHAQLRNRKGWRVDVWTVTDAGRDALNPSPRYRPDRPRFMARPTRNTGDYTNNPMRAIDHLEVVARAALASFAQRAREAEQERRRENGVALDARAFGVRIEQARLAARLHRMDITGEVWLIRGMADRGREQAALRRLARLEGQLQQRAA